MDLEAWQSELTTLLGATLDEFESGVDEVMETFAVDCHPWDGTIALAFLTSTEAEGDPLLREVSEMAAWKYYDFAAKLKSWKPASPVTSAMRTAYQEAGEERHEVARRLLRGVAAALASKSTQRALSQYRLARDFSITVPHPDTGEEYYRPA